MTAVLGIETATDVCGVSLLLEGTVAGEQHIEKPRAHAESLAPMIQRVLASAGCPSGALTAIAVSEGPGSYTGLRIGVSTAKGLAMATGARLVGVPTLLALAVALHTNVGQGLICSVMPARKGEWFAAGVIDSSAGLVVEIAAQVIAEDALPQWITTAAALNVIGVHADHFATTIRAAAPETVVRVASGAASASAVARVGLRQLRKGLTADVGSFEPTYLRPFVVRKPRTSAFEKLPTKGTV